MSLHGSAGACILVARASPIHVLELVVHTDLVIHNIIMYYIHAH